MVKYSGIKVVGINFWLFIVPVKHQIEAGFFTNKGNRFESRRNPEKIVPLHFQIFGGEEFDPVQSTEGSMGIVQGFANAPLIFFGKIDCKLFVQRIKTDGVVKVSFQNHLPGTIVIQLCQKTDRHRLSRGENPIEFVGIAVGQVQ